MSFANPVGTTGDAAAAYVSALLAVLGDRDPLEVQRGLIPAVLNATAGLTDEQLRTPEAPGKWSVLEVVQHLADSELVNGYRLRSMVAADVPEMVAYDQDAWATRLRYNEEPFADVVEELALLRRRNLRFLDRLSEEEWERTGLHSERGPESVRHLTRLLAAHDLVHLRQIERTKQAVGV